MQIIHFFAAVSMDCHELDHHNSWQKNVKESLNANLIKLNWQVKYLFNLGQQFPKGIMFTDEQ